MQQHLTTVAKPHIIRKFHDKLRRFLNIDSSFSHNGPKNTRVGTHFGTFPKRNPALEVINNLFYQKQYVYSGWETSLHRIIRL